MLPPHCHPYSCLHNQLHVPGHSPLNAPFPVMVLSLPADQGWGFTVSLPSESVLRDFSGPVDLAPGSQFFVGATHHSNNAAELSSLIFALHWVLERSLPSAVIEFDSTFASDAVRRLSRPRTNLVLVLRARTVVDACAAAGINLFWHKVAAHRGFYLNERADQLANCGAAGMIVDADAIRRWASWDFG